MCGGCTWQLRQMAAAYMMPTESLCLSLQPLPSGCCQAPHQFPTGRNVGQCNRLCAWPSASQQAWHIFQSCPEDTDALCQHVVRLLEHTLWVLPLSPSRWASLAAFPAA